MAPSDAPPPERRSADDIFTMSVAAMISRFADRPDRLRRVLNGLALDGSFQRCRLPSGLAPMMRLPGPDPERLTRARMADLMVRRYAADGNVTEEDLRGGGFTDAEITKHRHAAARIARLAQMAT